MSYPFYWGYHTKFSTKWDISEEIKKKKQLWNIFVSIGPRSGSLFNEKTWFDLMGEVYQEIKLAFKIQKEGVLQGRMVYQEPYLRNLYHFLCW